MKLAQLFGKNQLDEMQERTMLTIESRGFWLVWSLLLVVLLVEGLLGFTMREMAGTWAVFMISCVYIVAACLRAGLWSRNIKATIGANLVGSLIAGAVIGVFTFIKMSAYGRLCLLCWLAPVLRRASPLCWRWWYSSFAALPTKSAMNSWKTSLTKKKKITKEHTYQRIKAAALHYAVLLLFAVCCPSKTVMRSETGPKRKKYRTSACAFAPDLLY